MIGNTARQPPSRISFIISSCLTSFAVVYLFILISTGASTNPEEITSNEEWKYVNYFDYIYALSYCKVFITLIKYVPQIYLNWKRKSTKG